METFSFSMLLFSLQAWVKVDPFAVSAVIVPFSSPTLPVQAWTAIAIVSDAETSKWFIKYNVTSLNEFASG